MEKEKHTIQVLEDNDLEKSAHALCDGATVHIEDKQSDIHLEAYLQDGVVYGTLTVVTTTHRRQDMIEEDFDSFISSGDSLAEGRVLSQLVDLIGEIKGSYPELIAELSEFGAGTVNYEIRYPFH